MSIQMTNAYTKFFLVKETSHPVFGDDFDYRRDKMSQPEAQKRFDTAWTSQIEKCVQEADPCDIAFVRKYVKGKGVGYINDNAQHRHFKIQGKGFIAQLPSSDVCDQLWLVSSAIKDPFAIHVPFAAATIVTRFEEAAKSLQWVPEQLAEKVLVDFLESVTRERFERLYEKES
jgi:hypothetical protein